MVWYFRKHVHLVEACFSGYVNPHRITLRAGNGQMPRLGRHLLGWRNTTTRLVETRTRLPHPHCRGTRPGMAKSALKQLQHGRSEHGGENTCHECNPLVSNIRKISDLRRHIASYHGRVYVYDCPVVGCNIKVPIKHTRLLQTLASHCSQCPGCQNHLWANAKGLKDIPAKN